MNVHAVVMLAFVLVMGTAFIIAYLLLRHAEITEAHMKNRFLIFAYSSYYPEGGWHDYMESAATLEAAKEILRLSTSDEGHVVDLETMDIVHFDHRSIDANVRS